MSKKPIKSGSKKEYPPPFSLRFTFEERAILDKKAGNMALGAYIRAKLLDEDDIAHRHIYRRKHKQPIKDHEELGKVLGELGKSRISNNLNQLAKGLNTGTLPVTPDTEKAIRDACADVQNIRSMLMVALDFQQ